MIASQQEYVPGILEFKSEEKADNFETLGSTVNIVTQEDVVKAANVTCLLRCSPNIEESHQTVVVAVQIAKDLDGWLEGLDEHRLLLEHL